MQSKSQKKSSPVKQSTNEIDTSAEFNSKNEEQLYPSSADGDSNHQDEEDGFDLDDDNTVMLTKAVQKSNIHPDEKREIIERVVMYKGPLPPPALLEQYEKVVPGLANQIFEMAIKEQDHQHKMDEFQMTQIADAYTEEKAIYEERLEFLKGTRVLKQQRQWIYCGLAALCIIIMGIGILTDKSIEAMAPVIIALGGLALMLIFGKRISGESEGDTEISEEDESEKDENNDEDENSDEDENGN